MAGQTLSEKILARHADVDCVRPDELIWVHADALLTHDVCGPATISIFEREFGKQAQVWDKSRIVIIPDHFIFTQDRHAQQNLDSLRRFAKRQGIERFYDAHSPRYRGVCHVALAEEGQLTPGQILFGTDSHTCTAGALGVFATGIGNTDAAFVMGCGKLWIRVPTTIRIELTGSMPPYLMAKDIVLEVLRRLGTDGATYQVLEFTGETISQLNLEERMTLCNMAIETGAKTGIMAADENKVRADHERSQLTDLRSDPDALFSSRLHIDVADLQPLVAKPHSPANVVAVHELDAVPIDCCYIGSCTGGKTQDFLCAAHLLWERQVRVDTYLVPATIKVAADLDRIHLWGQSLRDIFHQAGARIGPPSCAACLGGPQDTFGRLQQGQVCLSATNRNFPGRMGDAGSRVFLASPLVVAASALTGVITDPREFMVSQKPFAAEIPA